jgi:hypothetical protein
VTRICQGYQGLHEPIALPPAFFASDDEPLCLICADRRRSSAINSEAVSRAAHELAALGFHPNGRLPLGYIRQDVELTTRLSGIPRRGSRPRYGIKLIKDETIADRVALAWKMKLAGSSNPEIHKATHLYPSRQTRTKKGSMSPSYAAYYHFFCRLVYTGIFQLDTTWYPLDWEQGARFCEPYITLEHYEQVQATRESYDPYVKELR